MLSSSDTPARNNEVEFELLPPATVRQESNGLKAMKRHVEASSPMKLSTHIT